jgi:hypothetical protein
MATESQQPPGEELPIDGSEDEQAPDADQSFMDKLRARRTAIANETRKEFDVPGYDGLMIATYKRMEYKDVMAIVRRVQSADKSQEVLNAHADLIIRAVVSIDAADGSHISDGYDTTLAGYFGIASERAREILSYVIANDLAMAAHSNMILAWMQSSQPEISEDFQGES